MAQADSSPVAEIISDSFTLTFRNWLLAVPTIAVSLIAFVPILIYGVFGDQRILGAFLPGATSESLAEIFAANTLEFLIVLAFCIVIAVVLGIIAFGATYAGAGDVLRGLPVDLGGIVRRGTARFGAILLFGLIIAGVGIAVELIGFLLVALTGGVLAILIVPLLFCAALAAAFLLMYAIPAIVLGGLSPGDAIGQSFDLARENAGTTVILIFSLALTCVGVWISTFLLRFVPAIGPLVSIVIDGFFSVFQALLVSKFYLDLMTSASPPMPDSQS